MLNFIPSYLKEKIVAAGEEICEVRLRADLPVSVTVNSGGNPERRLLNNRLTASQIEDCVMKLCDYSLFSVEESLKRGFITSEYGERVGVCGEVVYENGEVKGVKNFTSLCVRYPRAVKGCSDEFFRRYIKSNSSVLVFSPPFHGKTTFIRDLGRNYSDKLNLNVLFVDERDELVLPNTYAGSSFDVLKYADKPYGLNCGVRTLNPDVIITDELTCAEDFLSVRNCVRSGVKIVASLHADKIENVVKRLENYAILDFLMFDYFVELNGFKVSGVYDGEMKTI